MNVIKASYAANLCRGKLVGKDTDISAVVRDNREVRGGELFAAISGERFDGHDFAVAAAECGASTLLVEREIETPCTQIVVSDTVKALGDIAKGYLATLPAKCVCITGSVGKTTTKEMCASVLSEGFKTHKTQGNYNNNIGLPLTIFGMDKSHEAAVLEIGTNHFGEIFPLADIANPDAAVITAIGESHLEAFGNKEGVLSEKIEILRGLKKDGVAILNGDDELLWGKKNEISHKVIWFGVENKECDVFGEILQNGMFESSFKVLGSETVFSIACGGIHNIRDALAAIAVGRAFGMEDVKIARGLASFKNTGMRQDVFEFEGKTIIRDCYNANPDSMKASLSLLSETECEGKKICVLGDMLELGENASELHREIGALAKKCASRVFVTGAFAEDYRLGAGESARVFEDKKSLAGALLKEAEKGDIILVKGSYGTKMWQVIEYLMEERN